SQSLPAKARPRRQAGICVRKGAGENVEGGARRLVQQSEEPFAVGCPFRRYSEGAAEFTRLLRIYELPYGAGAELAEAHSRRRCQRTSAEVERDSCCFFRQRGRSTVENLSADFAEPGESTQQDDHSGLGL